MYSFRTRISTTFLGATFALARAALAVSVGLAAACDHDRDGEWEPVEDLHEDHCSRMHWQTEWLDEPLAEFDISRDFACARSRDGRVRCLEADDREFDGSDPVRIGDDTATFEGVGTELEDTLIDVAIGHAGACALLAGGLVRCWGSHELGSEDHESTGGQEPSVIGFAAALSESAIALEIQEDRTCATLASGAVRCWDLRALDSRARYEEQPLDFETMMRWGDFPHIVVIGEGDSFLCAG